MPRSPNIAVYPLQESAVASAEAGQSYESAEKTEAGKVTEGVHVK